MTGAISFDDHAANESGLASPFGTGLSQSTSAMSACRSAAIVTPGITADLEATLLQSDSVLSSVVSDAKDAWLLPPINVCFCKASELALECLVAITSR